MNARSRRRRAAVLGCLSLALGGVAASQVHDRARQIEAQVGAPVPVLVAQSDIEAGTKLEPGEIEGLLAVREVPERFAPPGSAAALHEVAGLRTQVAIPAGGYVTAAQLGAGPTGAAGPAALERGERALELGVVGGSALADATGAGGAPARVDVLVTTDPRSGAGRTSIALENVELLGLRPGDDGAGSAAGEDAAAKADAIARLRVTVRQAVFLTAAQNFAREIRLLVRSPGDRRRAGEMTVEAGAL